MRKELKEPKDMCAVCAYKDYRMDFPSCAECLRDVEAGRGFTRFLNGEIMDLYWELRDVRDTECLGLIAGYTKPDSKPGCTVRIERI